MAPDGKDFEDVIEYIMDPTSIEKLQLLLSDGAWERFVMAANVSRDEADALYEDLSKLKTLMAVETKDMPSKEELHRKRFMDEFPLVKQELEEHIRELYALAEEVDKVHRDCTISKVVARSTSVVSGILSIVGLALAPVTAGASLALLGTGIGLGVAASVTSVSSSIVEHSKNVSAQAKASRLVKTAIKEEEVVLKVLRSTAPKIVFIAEKCIKSLINLVKHGRAFKLVKSNPSLAAQATRFMTTGVASVRSSRRVQKAFGGTALAMTKGARIFGATTAAVFLLIDAIELAKESKHLAEGPKTQSAEELRQQAQELETKLQELISIHKML